MAEKKFSKILRAMTSDGSATVLVINSREIVNEARRLHNTAPTATAALGRVLTAASLMGTKLKEKNDTLTLTFSGDGEAGRIMAVSDYMGNVKGYIENPLADPPRRPDGKLNVGAAIGAGMLSVVRECGDGPLQTGMTEIVTGEVAEDIAAYYSSSEQVPTLISLGVLVDRDYTCLAAGGVLIQLLPMADESTVALLERNASELSNISRLFNQGLDNRQIADIALRDIPYDPFDEISVEYHCDCSRSRMKRNILSLGKQKVADLLCEQESEGKVRELTAECHFCGKSYTFTEKELLG